MQVTRYAICANCDSTTVIDVHAKCTVCGSPNVVVLGTSENKYKKFKERYFGSNVVKFGRKKHG